MINHAIHSNADIIIFDLEDAVPDDKKDYARKYIIDFLNSNRVNKKIGIRINSMETPYFYQDMYDIYGSNFKPDYIIVPKSEDGINHIYKFLGIPLIALIETPSGVENANRIAAYDGVVMISYAAGDLSFSAGGNISGYLSNVYVKTKIVLAARSAGIEAVDKVYFDLENSEGFRLEAVEAKSLGYSGKQVIHPSQIDIASEVFSPSRDEIEWARSVIAEYGKSIKTGKGALRLNGELIDSVHIRMAKKILEAYETIK